ncbi:MAG: dockerin type I domain-containing protein, partial [Rubripirellula sp.]
SKEDSSNSMVSDLGTSTRLVFNDVNADNRVSAMDALQVINKLSRSESQENLAEGEQLESTWLPYQYDMDEASLLAIDRSTDAVYRQKDWETDNGEDRDSDDCSESDPKNLRGRIPSTTHHHSRVDEARDLIFLAFGRDDRQDAKDDTLDRDNFQGAREDALKSCLDVFYK